MRRSGKLEKSPPANIETEPDNTGTTEEGDADVEKDAEENNEVGDIVLEVADVAEGGDGVGACVVNPTSSKRYPWATFSPPSSTKKHDVSSTPLSMI